MVIKEVGYTCNPSTQKTGASGSGVKVIIYMTYYIKFEASLDYMRPSLCQKQNTGQQDGAVGKGTCQDWQFKLISGTHMVEEGNLLLPVI